MPPRFVLQQCKEGFTSDEESQVRETVEVSVQAVSFTQSRRSFVGTVKGLPI